MPSLATSLWNEIGASISQEMFGVSVSYSRGSSSVSLTAIPSVVDYGKIDAMGEAPATIATMRDYLISCSAIVISSAIVEPRRGDRITETINGASQVFEVMPLENRPAAELQHDGARWLVHCKRVT